MSACHQILKYPQAMEAQLPKSYSQGSCWHGNHKHGQDLINISSLSLHCADLRKTDFLPSNSHTKKNNFAGKPIVMEPFLTPLLCKASSLGT